jgi:hypothetical protein
MLLAKKLCSKLLEAFPEASRSFTPSALTNRGPSLRVLVPAVRVSTCPGDDVCGARASQRSCWRVSAVASHGRARGERQRREAGQRHSLPSDRGAPLAVGAALLRAADRRPRQRSSRAPPGRRRRVRVLVPSHERWRRRGVERRERYQALTSGRCWPARC